MKKTVCILIIGMVIGMTIMSFVSGMLHEQFIGGLRIETIGDTPAKTLCFIVDAHDNIVKTVSNLEIETLNLN